MAVDLKRPFVQTTTDEEDDSDVGMDVEAKKCKKKERFQITPEKLKKLSKTNPELYEAVTTGCSSTMIRKACHNIGNYANFPLAEWSEAVLARLCKLKSKKDVRELSWPKLRDFVTRNQFCPAVSENLEIHINCSQTLISLFDKNRTYKESNYPKIGSRSFVTDPLVNYNVLDQFQLSPDVLFKQPPIRLPMILKTKK